MTGSAGNDNPLGIAAAPDARKEARVRVKWRAQVLLADGQVVPVQVRDISDNGIALASERPITQHAALRVAVLVPDIDGAGTFSTITGTVRTAHATVSGPDLVYGGAWQSIDGQGAELIRRWTRKLKAA